jgi:plastocyanin
MLKKSLFFFAAASLIFLTGCTTPQIKSIRDTATPPSSASIPEKTNLVTISNNKIEPAAIEVSAGDTVIFQNSDQKPHQIASDPHPAHTDLPDLYSPPIYEKDTYSYTFTKVGTWFYHLEDNPSIRGEVVVK